MANNNQTMLSRIMRPLIMRVRLMVAKGVVELVNDSLKAQSLQVSLLADETKDDVERFQEYGFTSTPFVGAEVLFLSVGGNRSHGVAVCVTDRRHRPKDLTEGDVCLFTDKGERVYLDRVSDIVNLGAKAAAEFVALATKTNDAIDGHEHAYLPPLIPFTPPVPVPTAGAHTPPTSDVAATKVKAT